jgi:NADH:ubiquinone reductase (H+-translocating)
MPLNIPDAGYKRIVILGGGFGGLTLAQKLANTTYQVILIDRNNYHQFQPLFYQVAMAGLEPSSIVFPFRKVFQKAPNVLFRVAEFQEVFPDEKYIMTDKGRLKYDYLVISMGADTNFFGNEKIKDKALPMKSVSEALALRNAILEDYETALLTNDEAERQALMDIVIVGGGATGVEVAGALAEMRKDVMPKEYKELNYKDIDIHLIHGGEILLKGMSEHAGKAAEKYLTDLGIKIKLDVNVTDYDGETVTMTDGTTLRSKKVIWAAGIVGNVVNGLPKEATVRGRRLKVNRLNQLDGQTDIYALGDIASMEEAESEKFKTGHPQVAQVAIQMAKNMGNNFKALERAKPTQNFSYSDLGSMATVGRNKAVVDLPFWRFQGFFAWFVWLFIHLFAIIGLKNKIFIFINWVWSYITYDQALRLIIRPKEKRTL